MDRPDLEAKRSITTISSLASDCTSGFKLCVESSLDRDIDAIGDARGRFNVWAANLGALQPPQSPKSLDFRLEDAEIMRTSIFSGLERLSGVQGRISRILTGAQPNRKQPQGSAEINLESNEPVLDELHELVLNMTTCIDHLFGLSILIRRLRPRGRVGQLSLFQPSTNSHRDIVTVIDKFPKAKQTPWLAERLGRANDQRRQFFAYRQQHRGQLGMQSERQEVLSDNDNATLRAATTIATTFEDDDGGPSESRNIQEDQRSVATAATSFVSDFDDSGQMGRRIPGLLDMTLDGIQLDFNKLLECPYCRTIQSFKDHLMWKKHVFSDLQPYVCTFENCSVAPFSTRDDWFQHELDNHRRRWECILCNSPRPIFLRKAQIETHFKDHHEGSITENQIDLIIGACESPMTILDSSACPLCSEWVPPSDEAINLREFRRHLARHLQQISLEALPLYIEGLAVKETLDQDDVAIYQKGVILDPEHFRECTGPLPKTGDEVLILDNIFAGHWWHVRVMGTESELQIPLAAIRIIGTITVPLGNPSAYPWLNEARGRRLTSPIELDPSKLRTWTARSGLFNVSAHFMGVENDKILLRKLGGVEMKVPREKLSFQDLAYVETVIETEFELDGHSDSESMEAQNSRPGADTSLQTAAFARIVSYGYTEDEAWYTVQVLLHGGRTWELARYREDFYDLHNGLLAEILSEPGNTKISAQLTHLMPEPVSVVTEAVMIGQLPDLNAYLRNLLEEPPLFSNFAAVKRFCTPRNGDKEIHLLEWSEPYTVALHDNRPSTGFG